MRRVLLPLLALGLLGLAQDAEYPVVTVRRWIAAARAHHPGEVDAPLISIASEPPEKFGVVLKNLKAVLQYDFRESAEKRNDVLRRGALLHTDIALLLPDQAAAYQQPEDIGSVKPPAGSLQPLRPRVMRQPNALVLSTDGEYVDSTKETGHWWFASELLRGVTPHPPADEFVRLWYRAIAASFQSVYLLGSGTYHMERALEVLPRDPVLLFYAGAMHEALASPRFQNIPVTAPGIAQELNFPTEDQQLRVAEGFLRVSIRLGGPAEAQLRLGRVLGRLGRHTDAVSLLEQTIPPAGDARFDYLRALFLGTELGEVGKLDVAKESLDRAASLFPTAQAPLIAMTDVFRRAGKRAEALQALSRLQALPADASRRTDPWWDYHRSYADDAGGQLAAVRAWVDAHKP